MDVFSLSRDLSPFFSLHRQEGSLIRCSRWSRPLEIRLTHSLRFDGQGPHRRPPIARSRRDLPIWPSGCRVRRLRRARFLRVPVFSRGPPAPKAGCVYVVRGILSWFAPFRAVLQCVGGHQSLDLDESCPSGLPDAASVCVCVCVCVCVIARSHCS